MSILHAYFGWPFGAVWSNLVASAICSGVVWWRLHRTAVRHHAETLAQAALHHRERLAQADAQHQAMKAHVTAATASAGAAAAGLRREAAAAGRTRRPGEPR